jgi:azurin
MLVEAIPNPCNDINLTLSLKELLGWKIESERNLMDHNFINAKKENIKGIAIEGL